MSISTIKNTAFPLTGRGFAFFFLSAAALLTGLLRFELAIMLWGGGFLFLLAYTWVGNILVRASVGRSLLGKAGHFDLSVSAEAVSAGSPVRLRVRAVLPGVILPVFFVSFRASLRWKTRTCEITGLLAAGENDEPFSLVPEKRGAYTGTEVAVLVKDLLGFTSSSLRLESANSLMVYPDILIPENLPGNTGPGGDLSAVRKTVSRSNELLDARKYYPGDDVRRIHWNMFAHLRDLYIRVGEEIPPPNSRILVALDTSVPALLSPKEMESFLDRAAAAACGCGLHFLQRGCELWLSRSGVAQAVRVSPGDRQGVCAFFAEAWWNGENIPRPENGFVTTCLFSFPSSPGYQSFLGNSGVHTAVLFPDPPPGKKNTRRDTLRRVLFRDPERKRKGLERALEVKYRRVFKTEAGKPRGLGKGTDVLTY